MSVKLTSFFFLTGVFLLYTLFTYTTATELILSVNYPASKVSEGKLLWQKNNCIACHQLYGLGGYLGPELTTVISQKGENYAKIFIKNGTQRMPNFNLSDEETNALIEYLKYIDYTAETYKK